MTQLVADCPRCGASKITFDLNEALIFRTDHGWQNHYETFCICRQCERSTIFVLSESVHADYKQVHQTGLLNMKGAVNQYMNIDGIISLKDRVTIPTPEHTPEKIGKVFQEGATCLTLACNNAAGTMFRLCIDLVTKELLPVGEHEGLNHRTKRDLGLRLPWLFDNGILPEPLRDLSACVREDGNDGAHKGTLTNDEANDLLDFTTILLERIYTEPQRVKVAQARRVKRREVQA